MVAPKAGDSGQAEVDEEVAISLARELLRRGRSPSRAAKEVAARMTIPRNQAYEIVLRVHEPPLPDGRNVREGTGE